MGTPPRSGTLMMAAVRAFCFSGVLILLLSWMLNANLYTVRLAHLERFQMWLILTPVMVLLASLSAWALERVQLTSPLKRFAVGALTRAVPLVLFGIALEFRGPPIAFAGMIVFILAALFVSTSGIYAMVVRGTGDYKSGAIATGVIWAWIIAYSFPLIW